MWTLIYEVTCLNSEVPYVRSRAHAHTPRGANTNGCVGVERGLDASRIARATPYPHAWHAHERTDTI